jgi:phosphatidylglycerol:prolipoprotein diacylglycerol transferase
MLPYIHIGDNLSIPSYNLFVGIGIALAMLFLQYQPGFKQLNAARQHQIHFAILLALLSGFAGAYVFDAVTQDKLSLLTSPSQVGLTLLGGVFTGGFVLCLVFKLYHIPILVTLNTLTLPFCIAHTFGRIGCFFAGCCFGKPTNSIFGVVFPVNSFPYQHYHAAIAIYPTQLFESAFSIVMFIVLPFVAFNNRFYSYVIAYSVFRFAIEFIRADDRGTLFNQTILSPSQLICIVTIIFVVIVLLIKQGNLTLKKLE